MNIMWRASPTSTQAMFDTNDVEELCLVSPPIATVFPSHTYLSLITPLMRRSSSSEQLKMSNESTSRFPIDSMPGSILSPEAVPVSLFMH